MLKSFRFPLFEATSIAITHPIKAVLAVTATPIASHLISWSFPDWSEEVNVQSDRKLSFIAKEGQMNKNETP